jgi:hypothetical protein
MEALKTAIHILNRVLSKSVPKTPYELWTGRVPSLHHLRVGGSPAEAKVFNPNIAKLDSKTVSCFFIGYPEKSKGFCFYCPDRYTKFVKTRHAVFLEYEMIRGSTVVRKIDLEEKRVCAPNPMIQEPYFSLPVVPAPTAPEVVVQAPVVTPPEVTLSEDLEPVLQDPIESTVAHEDETQQLPDDDVLTEDEAHDVPTVEAPRRSQRVKRSAIPDDYKVYNTEIAHIVVWTSLGPLPRWVPGPTTRWAPGTTRLALHGT